MHRTKMSEAAMLKVEGLQANIAKIPVLRGVNLAVNDGETVAFDGNGTGVRDGRVPAGRVFIDGKGVGDVGDVVLRDRRRLAHEGLVIVVLQLAREEGTFIDRPEIITRGFVYEDVSQELLEEARVTVEYALMELDGEVLADEAMVQAKVRSSLKKFFYKSIERRPMILPLVMEL